MNGKGPARACPICGKPVELADWKPFCSPRCKRVDLNRWLGEAYRVPVVESDDDLSDGSDDDA